MRVHVCECARVYVRNVENECIAYIGLFFIFLTKYDACLILLHITIFILKRHQLLSFHRIKKQNKKKKAFSKNNASKYQIVLRNKSVLLIEIHFFFFFFYNGDNIT